MKPSWTKEQQQVIDLRDRNILVSAAAGSGKTAVLVERIITKITQEEEACDIDRLLVVTFTKAAAAEMRARIGAALEEKIQEQPTNQHLQKQASLLHTAQITTIDSFCQNIIRNYFHVIDLDPTFRVGDETDLKIIKEDILKELIEEKYLVARETKNDSFLRFTDAFSTGRTDSAIEEMVLSLYDMSNSYPWQEEWLQDCADMYQLQCVEDLENSAWAKKLVAYLQACTKNFLTIAKEAEILCRDFDGPEAYLEAIQSDVRYLEQMQKLDSYQKFADLFTQYNPARLKAIRSRDINAEKKEHVKNLRNSYQKNGLAKLRDKFFFQPVEEMLSDIQVMSPLVNELIKLTLEFRDAFMEKKREEGIIDFSDMEHFALKILVDKDENGIRPSETALELQEYYDEILTDEYQDSNYVQELLLTSLCRAPKQKPYLFMVGDVKQSIYKFRLARPELFMEKYDRYTIGQGPYQRIDLHQNFRSRSSVLESANHIFKQIMQKEFGGIEYDDSAKLVPGADFCKEAGHIAGKTELLLIESQAEDEMLEKKPLEAAVIGQKIRDIVQGENPLQIKDKNGYRPVRYGDIAILLRSLSGWSEDFIETLSDLGIPAYSETKTGYFTTLEVETILSFLQVIDNPRQDIPLVTVLRSCLVGLTDEELAWLGTLPQEVNYWDRIQNFLGFCNWKKGKQELSEEYGQKGIELERIEASWKMEDVDTNVLQEKLFAFVERLLDYQKYSQSNSVYELLRRIYNETNYYQIMSAMPAGEKRRANLDILLQQAIEFAQNGHRGIYGFTHYIENLQKSSIDFGEASITNENTDAVRIMTIHKSKGLEFPIVFVAGMGKQFNLMDARKSTIISGDYGVGCDFVDLEMRIKQPTLIKRFMANEIVLSTLTEEIRILYVALTRAKEQLYITGTAKNLNGKLGGWLEASQFLGYYQLSAAQTYLEWIVPAIAKRDSIRNAIYEYLENAEDTTEYFKSKTDDLFQLEILTPKEIVNDEKIERKDSMLQYQRLQNWNIDVSYDDDMRTALEQQLAYSYPYEQDADLPVKVSVSELKRRQMVQMQKLEEEKEIGLTEQLEQKAEIPKPSFMQETKEVSGAVRGTLYHLVMEHFPYKRMEASQELWESADFAAYLEEMVQRGYMSSEEMALLDTRKFVAFADSTIGKRMVQAAAVGTLRLEQPFMLGIKAEEIEKDVQSKEWIMVQGIIDAFFIEDEEIVLVDYKTDSVRKGQENELIQKYQAQLDYYAQALERLLGKKVSEKIIYSFALNKELRVK